MTGFIPHVAGGKRGEFNQRFAQPSSQASRSTNSLFPFSDGEQTDPETGLTDGLLSRLSSQGTLPKIMYTHTPSEYWAGHGSLPHTTLDGMADLEPPEEVRIYVFASAQHGLGSFPLTDSDPVDGYRGRHKLQRIGLPSVAARRSDQSRPVGIRRRRAHRPAGTPGSPTGPP